MPQVKHVGVGCLPNQQSMLTLPFQLYRKKVKCMEKLSLKDLADLARAGFKVNDIKEIIASQNAEAEKAVEEPAEIAPKESAQPDLVKVQNEEAENGVDYKKMYEEAQKDIITVKEQLKKAQEFNTSQELPASNEKSFEEQLNELYKDII